MLAHASLFTILTMTQLASLPFQGDVGALAQPMVLGSHAAVSQADGAPIEAPPLPDFVPLALAGIVLIALAVWSRRRREVTNR